MLSLLIAAAVVLSTLGVACVTLKIRDALNRGELRPVAYFLRSTVLSPEERQRIADGYKKIAGMDVETLNQRPPIVLASASRSVAAQ